MKKQQLIVVAGGVVLLGLLFVFGKTVPSKTDDIQPVSTLHNAKGFNIRALLDTARANLTPARQGYVNSLESAVVRGDVKAQQIQLTTSWQHSGKIRFKTSRHMLFMLPKHLNWKILKKASPLLPNYFWITYDQLAIQA